MPPARRPLTPAAGRRKLRPFRGIRRRRAAASSLPPHPVKSEESPMIRRRFLALVAFVSLLTFAAVVSVHATEPIGSTHPVSSTRPATAPATQPAVLPGVRRILILGDSITYAGGY